MWFSMPDGCGGISVEQQQFECEVRDENGKGYFRAPDHFGPRILAIPGFALATPPEGSPEDLPKADPLRDGSIEMLTRENAGLRLEMQGMREDIGAATARVVALMNEKSELERKLREAEDNLTELQAEVDDGTIVPLKKAAT